MAVSMEDARKYLAVDVADDALVNANITRALAAATAIVLGAVGEDIETYLPGDTRTQELILIYMDDLYTERGLSGLKVSYATRRLVADLEMQLRLELAKAKADAAAVASEEVAET